MKASELRDLTADELRRRLDEEKNELSTLRFQHAVAPLQNPMVLREKRRDIARLQTTLRAKEQSA